MCPRPPSGPATSRRACCPSRSTSSRGQPFPGDQIPSFFQNPIGQGIAALYPLPNRNAPLANYVSSPNLEDRNEQFDVRVDRRSEGGLDLSARYSFSDRTLLEPFAGSGILARARLRQHARSSRAESGGVGRERDHAAPAERGAFRLHARRQPGEPGRPGHQHQPAGRPAGAVGEPARLGPELHHGHRLLADRAGIQQPAEGHHRRLPVRGHAHVEPRRAPGQGRVRSAHRAAGCVP